MYRVFTEHVYSYNKAKKFNIYIFSAKHKRQKTHLGTPLAQSVECCTVDRKVAVSNFTRGAVLRPLARHIVWFKWFNPGKHPEMTEKLLTGT